MKKGLAILVAATAIGNSAAQQQEAVREADPPLVVNGDLALTTRDFMAYMERVPSDRRAEFRTSLERISKTVDGLWLQRAMAKKSIDAGLDKDPLVMARRQGAQESVLADAYVASMERAYVYPDVKVLEARARELYLSRPERFTIAEEVHVQHVLVGPTWRTEEMAIARAKEIREKAVVGKEDFLSLARRYSDDASAKTNEGDLGWSNPTAFVGPFAEAVAKMKTPGEVSEPVRTQFGFHVIKFLGRKEARPQSFEAVKQRLIADEKDRLFDDYKTNLFARVRGESGTHVYLENVEKLKVDIPPPDPKEIARAQAEALKREQPASKPQPR
jgi:peptidyl-prolyl cis-trans isomerase C